MKLKPHVPSLLVLLGLAVYLVLFYATRLPSIEGSLAANAETKEQVWRRIDFLPYALLYPEQLWETWSGGPANIALADRLPVLTLALAILACATAVGWLLLAAFRVDRQLDRLETWVFSTVVGLNALSTYVLLVGLLGWVSSRLILAPPLVVALAAGVWWWKTRTQRIPASNSERPRQAKGGSRNRGTAPRKGTVSLSSHEHRDGPPPTDSPVQEDDALSLHWLWLAAPFVLVILLGAMLPPVDFDVREYHLQAPKEFFQQGRIGFLPHNVYANMPLGSEMLCLLAMNVAGDWWLGALVGKTLLGAFAPLTALGLLVAGRRFFSTTAGVVAAVVYLSIPWVVQVSTSGLVEGASACYLLLAVYAMLLWRHPAVPGQPSPVAYLGLAGYLAGGAVSCKYPAALFVVVPMTVWLVAAHWPRPWRTAWKPLGVFLLATALGCGLWFGKNWVLTGNPTYPLLSEILDGKTRTPAKDQQWNRVHRPKTFSVAELGSDLTRVGLSSEWLSPLVMPLAVLGLFSRRQRRLALILFAWFAYTIVAWWLFTHRIDRFWIPVLPLVAMLAGLGACWTPQRWCCRGLIELPLVGLAVTLLVCTGMAGLPFLLMAILAAVLAWRLPERLWLVPLLVVVGVGGNLVVATAGGGGYNHYFESLERLRSDPERLDAWHREFNLRVKQGRVLMVGDAQMFDLEVPVLYNTCFDDCLFEQLVRDKTPEQIRAALASKEVSYVFVHWGEIARYRVTGYGFSEFVQPAVFDRLVEQKILEPLPAIPNHSGRAYRVVY